VSNEAITWALTRPIKHSTAKFVLVVMANCADTDRVAWPSVAHLTESTGQDRKTVLENVKRLIVMGYIEDTGERKGVTRQVIVYRLKDAEIGTLNKIPTKGKRTPKQSQKRDSTENGTVPNFPDKSPVIPVEQSQISAETVPKTGHGNQIEPSIEPSGKPNKLESPEPKYSAIDELLAVGVDRQVAKDWLRIRKGKKAEATKTGIDGVLNQIAKAGMTPDQGIRICCERSWAGFNPAWLTNAQGRAPPANSDSRLGPAGQATAANAQRWLESQNEQ
jgi:hypothetical protein